MISVAVLVAVVYQCIFLLVFIVLNKKNIFLSAWSHKGLSFLNLGLIVFCTGTRFPGTGVGQICTQDES